MPYSDDPLRDFDAWEAEQTEQMKRLPVCDNCDRPIQDEKFFYYHGDKVCHECMETHLQTHTEIHSTPHDPSHIKQPQTHTHTHTHTHHTHIPLGSC